MNDSSAKGTVKLGVVYLIESVNREMRQRQMTMAHPMHIHGQRIQIIDRQIANGY